MTNPFITVMFMAHILDAAGELVQEPVFFDYLRNVSGGDIHSQRLQQELEVCKVMMKHDLFGWDDVVGIDLSRPNTVVVTHGKAVHYVLLQAV